MAYNNKQYNTRFSGRYNSPGQFVSAGDQPPPPPQPTQQQQTAPSLPVNIQPPAQPSTWPQMQDDEKMESEASYKSDDSTPRPSWMKSKLPGVKKVSNKERRRRQNENLRRLLTPKNALMVLNEMMPNEQVTNQFKVEPSGSTQYYKPQNSPTFCADLTIDGNSYKGYGDNKLMARNAAAEQAIRDLIIKKMNKVINSDSGSATGDVSADEESLPMIQLASFALHKLFSEWEYDGHKVPQLKPPATAVSPAPQSEAAPAPAAKKVKELPHNAPHMHPCMLLTYMRPALEYRELAVQGDRPQNMMFTMGVDIDGETYVGKASNKKEARKCAAKAACTALFGVQFEHNASDNTPQPPQ